jgi:hypothetical protein
LQYKQWLLAIDFATNHANTVAVMKKWEDVKAEMLKDPQVQSEYKKLEAEYRLRRLLLRYKMNIGDPPS